jgi:arsenate reductase (glutaredoxin)
MSAKIYHNPRCSKSRDTLKLLQAHGIEPEIIEYLKTPPSKEEFQEMIRKLGIHPRDLMRKKEPEYRDNWLDVESVTEDELIEAMRNIPKLMERPVVIIGEKAAIGRPPENVLAIL